MTGSGKTAKGLVPSYIIDPARSRFQVKAVATGLQPNACAPLMRVCGSSSSRPTCASSLNPLWILVSWLPEAIGTYEEITHTPGVPVSEMTACRIKLAELYEKNGQKAEALAQYREALRSEPNNATATAAVKRLGG